MSSQNARVSLVIPVLNEFQSIEVLIESILNQKIIPNDVIFVDGGSSDGTLQLLKQIQKEIGKKIFSVYHKPGYNIAKSRNFGASRSAGDYIFFTDAGCKPEPDWILKIMDVFARKDADVVAGGYTVVGNSFFQKLSRNYFGITDSEIKKGNFLPSARSLAVKRIIFNRSGGFPEHLKKAGEDTLFNFNLVRRGVKIICEPKAVVLWYQPGNLLNAIRKLYAYSFGDGESNLFRGYHYKKMGHSCVLFLLIFRYLFFLILLFLKPFLGIFFIFFIGAVSFKKLHINWIYYIAYIPIKTVLDLTIIVGFISGLVFRLRINAHRHSSNQKRRKEH